MTKAYRSGPFPRWSWWSGLLRGKPRNSCYLPIFWNERKFFSGPSKLRSLYSNKNYKYETKHGTIIDIWHFMWIHLNIIKKHNRTFFYTFDPFKMHFVSSRTDSPITDAQRVMDAFFCQTGSILFSNKFFSNRSLQCYLAQRSRWASQDFLLLHSAAHHHHHRPAAAHRYRDIKESTWLSNKKSATNERREQQMKESF